MQEWRRATVRNGVRGIVGECGGHAMCATCYVYVRAPYLDALPERSEDGMLDCAIAPRDDERSRLSCQISVGQGLDEIQVNLPPSKV